MDLKLEIVVLPVADVDRSKAYYERLGFRLDADFSTANGLRVVQATPPGSATSIIFGEKVSTAAPGSVRGLHLVTTDIATARDELIAGGAAVSELWHDADGIFHWGSPENRLEGPHPDLDSYGTYASFEDPDGNEWVLQQIVDRLPGR